jgi:hypothetical protein
MVPSRVKSNQDTYAELAFALTTNCAYAFSNIFLSLSIRCRTPRNCVRSMLADPSKPSPAKLAPTCDALSAANDASFALDLSEPDSVRGSIAVFSGIAEVPVVALVFVEAWGSPLLCMSMDGASMLLEGGIIPMGMTAMWASCC